MSSVLLSKFSPDHIMSPDTDREIERVEREADLIRQRDRIPIAEDKSPDESFDSMLKGLLFALKRRLQ